MTPRSAPGSVRPDEGTIVVDGQPAPIAIIYQELDLFPHLGVGENIVIGNLHFREGRFVRFQMGEE